MQVTRSWLPFPKKQAETRWICHPGKHEELYYEGKEDFEEPTGLLKLVTVDIETEVAGRNGMLERNHVATDNMLRSLTKDYLNRDRNVLFNEQTGSFAE